MWRMLVNLHRIVFLVLIAVITTAHLACSSSSSAEKGDDPAPATEPKAPSAQELFIQANEALDDRDWSAAIDLYEQVTEADPERWDAHMNRGIALTHDEQFTEATDAFADAFAAGGDTEPMVYFNLGNHYQERGLHEAAIDAYRTSMAHRGELHYGTLLNISASLTFINAHDKARQTIEQALKLDPDDPRAHLTLGLTAYSEGDPDQALEIYDELVAVEPNYAPAHYNRGFVLLRMGEDTPALNAFQTYLELAPDGPYVKKAESHISIIERRQKRE